ncbi:hypothetical protein BROUX41_001387 [Berkeleyomyces rouxiae]|uniref:uncharacterized protein n=1 Tax=Berkeleyomyces rouxiae TaxID=2035830 RepID=UPI003B808C75
MRLLSLILAVAITAVSAQRNSGASTTATALASGTDSETAATHTVLVGENGSHVMSPNVTYAKVGDYVRWLFSPQVHSVIRGAETQACIPYELANVGATGFYSGVQYVTDTSSPPAYQIQINDTTEPIFYYCGAVNSCKGFHMVGVINPNTSAGWTFDHYYGLAETAPYELLPGEDWPSESTATVSDTTPSATSSSAPASSSSDSSSSSSSSSLSPGAIAGISIGSIAVLIGAILAYFCGRRRGEANQTRLWPWGASQNTQRVSAVPSSDVTDLKSFSPLVAHSVSPPISPGHMDPQALGNETVYYNSDPYHPPNGGIWTGSQQYSQIPMQGHTYPYAQQAYPIQHQIHHQHQHSISSQILPVPQIVAPSELANTSPSELSGTPQIQVTAPSPGGAGDEVTATTTVATLNQGGTQHDDGTAMAESPTISSALPEYSTQNQGGSNPKDQRFSFAPGGESEYRPLKK